MQQFGTKFIFIFFIFISLVFIHLQTYNKITFGWRPLEQFAISTTSWRTREARDRMQPAQRPRAPHLLPFCATRDANGMENSVEEGGDFGSFCQTIRQLNIWYLILLRIFLFTFSWTRVCFSSLNIFFIFITYWRHLPMSCKTFFSKYNRKKMLSESWQEMMVWPNVWLICDVYRLKGAEIDRCLIDRWMVQLRLRFVEVFID